MKLCGTCKIEKTEQEFYPNKTHYDGLGSSCKKCNKIYKENYYIKNKQALRNKIHKDYSTKEGRVRYLLHKSKDRSKELNLPHDITAEDLIIPDVCPYLQTPLTYSLGEGRKQFNASLDRIDSSKGYVKGNVQIISCLANVMKNCATIEQLKTFSKSVLQLHE